MKYPATEFLQMKTAFMVPGAAMMAPLAPALIGTGIGASRGATGRLREIVGQDVPAELVNDLSDVAYEHRAPWALTKATGKGLLQGVLPGLAGAGLGYATGGAMQEVGGDPLVGAGFGGGAGFLAGSARGGYRAGQDAGREAVDRLFQRAAGNSIMFDHGDGRITHLTVK